VRRHSLAVVIVAASTIASCGGGSVGTKTSGSWDVNASQTARTLAAEMSQRVKGACADFGLIDRAAYVASARRIHSAVPLAVADCSALGESVEISVFADRASRAAFVRRRAQVLCDRAAKVDAQLPGLHWVVGAKWSMQPDSEAAGRDLAHAIGGSYLLTACKGAGQVDWADEDVTNVDMLAARLETAGVGCRDFALQDRELLSHNPHYVQVGLPGAYGKCTVSGDAGMQLASFTSKGSTPMNRFLSDEASWLCTQSKSLQVVSGADWAAFVRDGQGASAIARALHGRLDGTVCRT